MNNLQDLQSSICFAHTHKPILRSNFFFQETCTVTLFTPFFALQWPDSSSFVRATMLCAPFVKQVCFLLGFFLNKQSLRFVFDFSTFYILTVWFPDCAMPAIRGCHGAFHVRTTIYTVTKG